ncbi:MAG: hypothetical protein ACLFQ6_09060 [Candidatus Sumerlaeia bacterium]
MWEVAAGNVFNVDFVTGIGEAEVRLDVHASTATITDFAGNSLVADFTSGQTFRVDTLAPSVGSIVRQTPATQGTNASTVVWRVSFASDIDGTTLAADDFTLTPVGGAVSGPSVTNIAAVTPGSVYDVTVDTGTGDGELRLDILAATATISDSIGNPLTIDFTTGETYIIDKSVPTAAFTAVTPDPRNVPVTTVDLAFSEDVTGVDIADFSLTLDGAPVTLGAEDLSAVDAANYQLLLDDESTTEGVYVLTLTAAGSGITDGINTIDADASVSWTMDLTGPTADIVDVSPDPTNTLTGLVDITFNEAITTDSLTIDDFELTHNSVAVDITSSATISDGGTGTDFQIDLTTVTAAMGEGAYTLRLLASSDVTDWAGNSLAADASDNWVIDQTPPTPTIVAVTPDPRTTPVNAVQITFDEDVFNVSVDDFTLTSNGVLVDISGSTLTQVSQDSYLLDISDDTAGSADFVLTLSASGSGIVDEAGNLMTADASDAWTSDFDPPTVDIVDVTPNPRKTSLSWLDIAFSEDVSGVDISDFAITHNGSPVPGTSTPLSVVNAANYRIYMLGITDSTSGTFVITLNPIGSGITDAAGNPLLAGDTETFEIDTAPPYVVDVSSPMPDGLYGIGTVTTITVTFNEAMSVEDSVWLNLDIPSFPAYAVYDSGDQTSTLSLLYTVEEGHESSELAYLDATALLTSGALTDLASNNAIVTLPDPGTTHSLSFNKDIQIDGIRPVYSNILTTPSMLKTGDATTITFTVSETLQSSPTVTVNGNAATSVSNSGLDYAFTYTALASDPEGWLDVVISGNDLAGNAGISTQSALLLIDNTPPTGTLAINDGSTYTATADVVLTLDASDGTSGTSGLANMRFSTDTLTWTAWEAYSSTRTWTLESGDGPKTLWVQYRDALLNTSAPSSDTIHLDTFLPESAVFAPTGTASTTLLTVEWNYADNGPAPSGVAQVEIWYEKVGTGIPAQRYATVNAGTNAIVFNTTARGPGLYGFYSIAIDNAGNREAAPATHDVTVLRMPVSVGEIFYEPFNYNGGFLTQVGSADWTQLSGNRDYRIQANGSLDYPDLRTPQGNLAEHRGGTATEDVAHFLDSPFSRFSGADIIMYNSFLLQVNSIPTGITEDYFFYYLDAAGGTFGRGRIYFRPAGTGFQVGLRYTSFGDIKWASSSYALGQTIMLVTKITLFDDGSRDQIDLFLNPTPGNPEPASANLTDQAAGALHDFSSSGIGGIAMRQTSSSFFGFVDEIRIGDTWESVTPSGTIPIETSVNTWTLYE